MQEVTFLNWYNYYYTFYSLFDVYSLFDFYIHFYIHNNWKTRLITNIILGFGEKVIFTTDNKKRVTSEEARKNLKYVEDLGTALVQDAGGYVFALNLLQKMTDKKKSTSIIASVIAEQLARTEITSECECSYKHGIFPAEECSMIDKKQRPVQVNIKPFCFILTFLSLYYFSAKSWCTRIIWALW